MDRDFFPESFVADGKILAEAASESTSAEKNSTAASGTADTWFLPVMEGSPCDFDLIGSLTESERFYTVCAAGTGAENTAAVKIFI